MACVSTAGKGKKGVKRSAIKFQGTNKFTRGAKFRARFGRRG